MNAIEFWASFSAASTGCFLWEGSKDRYGYGHLRFEGNRWMSHRLAYVLTKGPIPEGLFVLHVCDNPSCGRPSHLFVGTQKTNMQDLRTKKSRFAHSKLALEQVLQIRRSATSSTKLARQYGVNRSTIIRIKNRRAWADTLVKELRRII